MKNNCLSASKIWFLISKTVSTMTGDLIWDWLPASSLKNIFSPQSTSSLKKIKNRRRLTEVIIPNDAVKTRWLPKPNSLEDNSRNKRLLQLSIHKALRINLRLRNKRNIRSLRRQFIINPKRNIHKPPPSRNSRPQVSSQTSTDKPKKNEIQIKLQIAHLILRIKNILIRPRMIPSR